MAIELIEALSGSAANGANPTINFVLAQDDDFALVLGGHQSNGPGAGVITAGYTELFDESTLNRFSASYKFLSGDTSVECDGGGDADDGEAYVVLVFRGVDTGSPTDATSTIAFGLTNPPNPPSITTVTDGAVVVAGYLLSSDRTPASPPSGYTTGTSVKALDVNDVACAAAYRVIETAGAENPGSFGFTAPDPSDDYTACSIALRPAVEGSFGDGSLSTTGTGTASFVGFQDADGLFSATGTGTATLKGNALVSRVAAMTGTNTTSWAGTSLATSGVLSATGTGTVSFGGGLSGSGNLEATGNATTLFEADSFFDASLSPASEWAVMWVGAISKMSSVREVIESRGAATVIVG